MDTAYLFIHPINVIIILLVLLIILLLISLKNTNSDLIKLFVIYLILVQFLQMGLNLEEANEEQAKEIRQLKLEIKALKDKSTP